MGFVLLVSLAGDLEAYNIFLSGHEVYLTLASTLCHISIASIISIETQTWTGTSYALHEVMMICAGINICLSEL